MSAKPQFPWLEEPQRTPALYWWLVGAAVAALLLILFTAYFPGD